VVAAANSSGSCSQRVRCVPVVLPDACQQLVEVGVGESPVEWPGSGVVVLVEGEDPGVELFEVPYVLGGEQLALDDGEVDLDLAEPGGVDWEVDHLALGEASLRRAAAGQLRREAPLSTTQKTVLPRRTARRA